MKTATHQNRDDVVSAAARWAAQIDSGDISADERAACEAWCRLDPSHRPTLDRMRAFDGALDQGSTSGVALRTLLSDRKRQTRRAGTALLGVALLAILGWQVSRDDWAWDHFPDHRTARGEQRRIALAEGSVVTLDTAGAIRVDLTPGRRRVRLIEGQILAEVSKDAARPFVVETDQGSATALGTPFTVRRDEGATTVSVISSAVRVCPREAGAGGERCRTLDPGERVTVSANGLGPVTRYDPGAALRWTKGWLVADDESAATVLAELDRYARQPLIYDAAALGDLRVTGSFPLTEIDRAVDGVARSARLTVRRSESGKVTIDRD